MLLIILRNLLGIKGNCCAFAAGWTSRRNNGMVQELPEGRREFLRASASGPAVALTACGRTSHAPADEKQKPEGEKGDEVTATEDLMREHGVIRRALLVYTATAIKLPTKGLQ